MPYNDDFVYRTGKGLFGSAYDASTPQGQIYGIAGRKAVPFWCRDPERRKLTMLRYMERRVGILKEPTSSFEDRYKQVVGRLARQWEKKLIRNEKRRDKPGANRTRYAKRGRRKRKEVRTSVFYSYGSWLIVTKDFPKFLTRIVDDYFPSDDDFFHWDIGQIAFNSGGGLENKSLVRDILIRVDRIGRALFREPPAPEVVYPLAADPQKSPEPETDKPSYDDPDFYNPF